MQHEIWRPVAGFEGLYSVSSLGRVRSESRCVVYAAGKKQTVRSRILRPAMKKSGHLSVQLYRGSEAKRKHVHQLVAIAFIGPAPSALYEVAHRDGIPAHNTVGNLRWATRSSNHADKIEHGTHNRGEQHPRCKYPDELVRKVRAATGTATAVAKAFGLPMKFVSAVRLGTTRTFS